MKALKDSGWLQDLEYLRDGDETIIAEKGYSNINIL